MYYLAQNALVFHYILVLRFHRSDKCFADTEFSWLGQQIDMLKLVVVVLEFFFVNLLKMYRVLKAGKSFRCVTIVVKCYLIALKIISVIIILLRKIKIGL